MKKIKLTFVVLFFCSFISCKSGVSVSEVTEIKNEEISTVHLFSKKEIKEINGLKIGNIVLKENSNLDWNFLKSKLTETGKKYGANLIIVNNVGYNLKGYGFHLEGEMYYSKNIISESQECTIGFIRDRFESVLGSAFSIKIKVNDSELGELKREKAKAYVTANCNEKVKVQLNNKEYEVLLNGGSKFFKIGKQTAGFSNGVGIQIGIGGLSVIEIEDEELGKLLYWQNK